MKIYLINGESYLRINEEIEKIVKDSKNVVNFDLKEASIDEVILEAGYYSMFQEEKYIIVKNANFFGSEKLSDKDNNLLVNYFAKPNSLSIIIFVTSEKVDLRKKVTKLIKDNQTLISIVPYKYYETENKVNSLLEEKGFKIDKEALKYIVRNEQNNYDLIMSEINKLVLYYSKPGFISYSDVSNIVGRTINTNNFLLVDAIIDGDIKKSLELFKDLKIIKEDTSIIFSLIARDIRIMLNIKYMLNKNKQEYEIMTELGLLDWQLDKYLKKIKAFKLKELEELLVKLADIDMEIKTFKKDKYQALELFILDICG